MANGRGRRWGDYLGIPKHLIEVDGETLLQRTTRLIHEADSTAEVFISSSFPSYEAEGATRHSPLHADHELDRFCYELICPRVCFLYGDTFYTAAAIEAIVQAEAQPLLFFGNDKSIVAIKSTDEVHLKSLINTLFEQIEQGEIEDAKGWDLYRLALAMQSEGAEEDPFVHMTDSTQDFNSPDDYLSFVKHATD